MWAYIFPILCLQMSWRLSYFWSFFSHNKFFLNDKKIKSVRSWNVRKYSNRIWFYLNKLCLQFSGLRMHNFMWNRFPIKNLLIDSLLTPIMESTYLHRDMCASLNHRKKTKADGSRLIPWNHTETLVLLSAQFCVTNSNYKWAFEWISPRAGLPGLKRPFKRS